MTDQPHPLPARRYLALGDSYTIGEGVAEDARWPVRLVAALREHGIALAEPHIVATTGWTGAELLAALAGATLKPPYALVSLLIGVNNQYRGGSAEAFRAEFLALLRLALDQAGQRPGRVLVVSIPDWGTTRFGADDARGRAQISAQIDAFNAVLRNEAAHAGCPFVDITPISRACGDDPDLLAADGLHPSAAQYARWLPPIVAAAKACLVAN